MVIAENDRTARGVQKGDRLWALFDKDEHGQEWWGGTVIQADLNSRGDGDVDVIFDDGEREVMRAKECFRRCEAGILRLRQARPNKKAERRLKQCGVVPRENHDIRLPPQQKARAPPKKKKATKKAASAVGARAQARAEAVGRRGRRGGGRRARRGRFFAGRVGGRRARSAETKARKRAAASAPPPRRAGREDPAAQAQGQEGARRRTREGRP